MRVRSCSRGIVFVFRDDDISPNYFQSGCPSFIQFRIVAVVIAVGWVSVHLTAPFDRVGDTRRLMDDQHLVPLLLPLALLSTPLCGPKGPR